MSRLRQLNPGNYTTSARISQEIENIVRYVNSAEHGDKTIGELLDVLFDSSGEFDGPVEFRWDGSTGLEYRLGTYIDAEAGWTLLISASDIRGTAGTTVGTVEGEIFHNRQEFTATAAQTNFTYSWEATGENLLVWKNGLLLVEGGAADYTTDQAGSLVQLNAGANLNDIITVVTIRENTVSNYRRTDYTATASQVVFAFVHTDQEVILVYKNGVLQQPGGANDYTTSATGDTVTFTSGLSGGDKVCILTVENKALSGITGLMLESAYTNSSGLIPYSKLSIADADIPQAKVNGLTTALTNRGSVFVSASAPGSPSAGDLWVDTSASPNLLKFYDGSGWLTAAPDTELPALSTSVANEYLRVNATGTALETSTVDLSSVVPKTYIGAADGVASLDSGGLIPISELPEIFAQESMYDAVAGSVSNGSQTFKRIFKQKIRIDGISGVLSAGTCNVQIEVDGTPVGSVHAISTTALDQSLGTAIEVDGVSSSRRVGYVISSATGATDLEVSLAIATVTV